ncbi:hypothetical protein OZN62_04900 [Aurantiacibacter sp. MUD11]|uniref:DUF6644 family protein n=1 Tax=Aurantiacibacter sp. MUD11 TaxID=3003265 RepID=UPI0022AB0FD1|nr:DUF6644 family protein [Aurantiacibacter sp. MUD11]WAT18912.1 hypothetical protein OZN62_04900 [Aurantiacibacter sp. MUD11]
MGDLLFEITDWMRGTFLLDWAFWMQETGFSLWMVENFWNVPIAQAIHIMSIAAAFAATLMVVLRVNGRAGAGVSVEQWGARFEPWIRWGLLVIVLSGLAMIFAEPVRNMINSVFWIKMIVLLVMVAVSLAYIRGVRAKAVAAGTDFVAAAGTKTTGWAIIVMWCLIMVCGRWIAYVPV